MTVDWIVSFQARIEDINDRFYALITLYPPIDDIEAEVWDLIKGSLKNTMDWVRCLVPDEAIWAWIDASVVLRNNLGRLHALAQGFLSLRGAIRPVRGDDHPLGDQLMTLMSDARSLRVDYEGLIQTQAPWFSVETPPQAVPPLVAIMGPLANTSSQIIKPVLRLDEGAQWPLITYHPVYTHNLLCQLIHSVYRTANLRGVNIAPERTPTHFEIRLTGPTLRLSPAIWDRLIDDLKTARQETNLELLYEMSGEITPLVYDEGQHGVLVRLPWAHPL